MATYRVLCLHGYRQNAEALRGRMSALRRALKSSMEFGAAVVVVVGITRASIDGCVVALLHRSFPGWTDRCRVRRQVQPLHLHTVLRGQPTLTAIPTVIAHLVDGDSTPAETEGDARQLAWWNYEDATATHAYWEAASSIEYIENFVRREGPFDGIFGFSQGGMIASMVLQHQRTFSPARLVESRND
jgi:hypothetical protein